MTCQNDHHVPRSAGIIAFHIFIAISRQELRRSIFSETSMMNTVAGLSRQAKSSRPIPDSVYTYQHFLYTANESFIVFVNEFIIEISNKDILRKRLVNSAYRLPLLLPVRVYVTF